MMRGQEENSKIFHDSVHGAISLHEVLVAIIDTPEYQRLRDIKQLGTAYWVFPGACHNRFEHGIGTSHLCGLMIEALRDCHRNNKEDLVEISDTEILCIKIAGLVHDLGHGPFSHFFDKMYMKRMYPELEWTHEDNSCRLFDHMINNNTNVKIRFEKHGITGEHCEFIKRIIKGRHPKKDNIPEETQYNNQTLKKSFLYEIVSNKRTGIDCDKFDYLARDAHYVGITSTFDFLRFFQNIKIIPVDGQLEICVRDKESYNLYELFHLRWRLHRQVYQHKTVNVTDELLYQGLKNSHKTLGIDEAINDPSKFLYLTDSIFYETLKHTSNDEQTNRSKLYLHKLQTRDFFKISGEVVIPTDKVAEIKAKNKENSLENEIASYEGELSAHDLFVGFAYMNLGMKGKNPVENVTFFKKNGDTFRMRASQLSLTFPAVYEELYLRVYTRNKEQKDRVSRAFTKWCNEAQISTKDNVHE